MGFIEAFNVKIDFSAVGDGLADDTNAIQNALNAVSTNGRGTVFFPSGIYKISSPLRVPPKCTLLGLSGCFTQDGNRDVTLQGTRIVLASPTCNIIEPLDTINFYDSVIIQGLILDGNRGTQKDPPYYSGIYMPDYSSTQKRSGMVVRDVMIMNVKGYGFYAGINQCEFLLDHVVSLNNSVHGFYFNSAQDISLNYVWGGSNLSNGFYFSSCAGIKSHNCDAWGNSIGVNLESSSNCVFHRLQTDLNQLYGVYVLTADNASFIGSIFANNRRYSPGSYTNVLLNTNNPNGYGPFGVKFIGCQFGHYSNTATTKSAIEDNSSIPRANIVSGCSFNQQEFVGGTISNILGKYIFEGCSAGNYGEIPFAIDYSWTSNDYTLTARHKNIGVDTTTGNKTIYLPSINSLLAGKEYLIIKASQLNTVVIQADAPINGSGNTFNFTGGPWVAKRFIHGGNSWLAI
ncbi:MAG TPA: glycosyl hydrolase family 28-related protein [Ignavibacteriales bacterium]|nr:glycosyl hydrolase family 28-related protein [Ignavibacteriales bacterium]